MRNVSSSLISRPAMAACRQSVLCLAAIALFLALPEVGRSETPRPANGSDVTRPGGSVVSVGFTVSDIDRSIAFYQQVLDFECIARTELAGAEFEQFTGVGGAWTLTREDPDFYQRLVGAVSADGNRIDIHPDASEDRGTTWRKDFDLTFERRA